MNFVANEAFLPYFEEVASAFRAGPSIDWNYIDGIDPSDLAMTRDKDTMRQITNQFINAVSFTVQNPTRLLRLFQILQVIMKHMNDVNHKLKKALRVSMKQNEKLKERNRKLVSRKKPVGIQCPICQKIFSEMRYVDVHVFAQHPDVKLVILGEGPERAALTRQAAELGIDGRVIMPGFIHNPHAIVRRASLFVLPSRFEGFPNALVEAMALARPVISYDCPSGPAYLIKDGVNGILLPVGEIARLTQQIDLLLRQPEKASALGREALKVRDYCNINRVMEKWTQLVDQIGERKSAATSPAAACSTE